ncbi:hypothetical protein QMP26_35385 [Enterocloster clostridioformis]|uniref:hypothetical protein n=1 Tax=Enterocloster clostridioformis TaxID=1531 RepID=UPI002674423F|nr:hypothetical protein [Enterocloster clostridioformis]
MNKCAVENVKNHIALEMHMCEVAEENAREEGKTRKCIEMYHDMFCLYAGFLAQLN